MKLQVLVATMHRQDTLLPEQMHLQTDAVIVNQCDREQTETLVHNGCTIRWVHMTGRGVGLSRNTAIEHADGDILLFADDDVEYADGYEQTVLNAFRKHPDVQLIVFNLQSLNPNRPEPIVEKEYRLHWYNCLKFGAFRIAVRAASVEQARIRYSHLFGGGAPYQAGEDNLFITDCLKAGMKGLASTDFLGTVRQEESTWFRGYDEKYYRDRGALFSAMYGKKAAWVLLLMELKSLGKTNSLSFQKRYRLGREGAKAFAQAKQSESRQ